MADGAVGEFSAPHEKAKVAGVAGRGVMPNWYSVLLEDVAARVDRGRVRVAAAANQRLVRVYWEIGREILGRQQEEGYGTRVIDRLAVDLKERFPGDRGFSSRNLKYMRAFAAAWPDWEVVQRAVAQLPWRHQLALLEKLETADQRVWYAEQALTGGWSRDTLAAKIAARLQDRSGRAITNFADALPAVNSELAQQATKDPYLFDFVGAAGHAEERVLETALITHIQRFLLELGQGFAFVGRQLKLTVGGEHLYPDLVFYHFVLRCFVVVELKTVKFDPGFLSQLGTYMAVIDDTLRQPADGPTVGLLLCKTKDNTLAEYALRNMKGPIGVADWVTDLETSLPDQMSATLPSIETLEAELAATDTLIVAEQAEVTVLNDGGDA